MEEEDFSYEKRSEHNWYFICYYVGCTHENIEVPQVILILLLFDFIKSKNTRKIIISLSVFRGLDVSNYAFINGPTSLVSFQAKERFLPLENDSIVVAWWIFLWAGCRLIWTVYDAGWRLLNDELKRASSQSGVLSGLYVFIFFFFVFEDNTWPTWSQTYIKWSPHHALKKIGSDVTPKVCLFAL